MSFKGGTMLEDYTENHIRDLGFMNKENLPYKKLKGFLHIWTYFKTSEGNFICSKYTKEVKNGLYIASIRNSPEGWVIHLFYGGAKFKSWTKTVNLLEGAEEYCNLFLTDKLIINDTWRS